MEKKKGRLFVFAAPSGSGKTTIVKSILDKFPRFVFSISATTRKKRDIEIEGKDYYFLTDEEFKRKIEADEFAEWERFYDYYYGSPKSFIDENIEKGISVLFDIDVKGALSIKTKYPSAILFFILPPSFEELKNRLIKRNTENSEDLKKRIERAEWEMSFSTNEKFDYIVVNDDLEKAKKIVEEIIEKEINKE